MVTFETNARKRWINIYEVTGNNYFQQSDVNFPKDFLLTRKIDYNFRISPCWSKNSIQQVGLEHGFFSHIIKIKHTLVAEEDKSQKIKRKLGENFKVNKQDLKIVYSLRQMD